MPAPTYVNSGALTQDVSGGISFTPTPGAHLANDILIAFAHSKAGDAVSTATAGWNAVTGGQSRVYAWWKRATGAGTAGPTITGTGGEIYAVVHTFRGCHQTITPVEDPGSNSNSAGSTAVAQGSLSPTGSDRLAVWLCGVSDDDAWTTAPPSGVAGWTNNSDLTSTTGTDSRVTLCTKPLDDTTAIASVQIATKVSTLVATTFKMLLIPPDPVVSQAAFRFYADDAGEASNTALAAQNTNIGVDVSSGNQVVNLRVRLQEGAGTGGYAQDDWSLFVSKNGGAYKAAGSIIAQNVSGTGLIGHDSTTWGVAQSFLGDGQTLKETIWRLSKLNSPTGNITAQIFASSAAFSSNTSLPTGAALATSDPIDVSTFSTTVLPITFTFSGANQIPLALNTAYQVATIWTGGVGSNVLNMHTSATSVVVGNRSNMNSSSVWISPSPADIRYILNPVGEGVRPYLSTNLTDSGATTNRLGAGSGSFVAGKVTEDGIVDDLRLTGSNYTELLFSLELDSTLLANGDTLDFRVYKNTTSTPYSSSSPTYAALGSYTVTGRITITNPTATFQQTAFGFYEDGTESGSTAIAAANTNISRNIETDPNVQLRIRLQETAAIAGISTDDYKLQFNKNSSGWTDVGSGAVVGFNSGSVAEADATTNRLGSGTGSFVAGKVTEDGTVDNLQITASNYTELLVSLTLVQGSLANNDLLDFRFLCNGAVINAYTVTPRVTVVKFPATPPVNHALQANGGVATASSYYTASGPFLPDKAQDGDRNGNNYTTGGVWHSATNGAFPEWLQIDFPASRTISEIDVFCVQDNYASPTTPTLTMTFVTYGIVNFTVEYWTGSAWTPVTGGTITGNNRVWKKFTGFSVDTTKIRLNITATVDGWTRVAELEAWGPVAVSARKSLGLLGVG